MEEEKENENLKGVKKSLTLASVGASAFGLIVSTGVLASKIITGDALGAAQMVGTSISFIGKITGLSPVFNKAKEYVQKKYGNNKVIKFATNAGKILTSNLVKKILKLTAIALLIAGGLSNPVTGAIVGLSLGAIAVNTAIASRNIGRFKRVERETKAANETLKNIEQPAKDKFPALDKFLASKLSQNKIKEVDPLKISTSTGRGSVLESASLILEAVTETDNLAAAAAVAVFGGLAGEAKEAIERQEERYKLLAQREEARIKVVCAALSKEPNIDNLNATALEEKYNEIYKSNFSKTFGNKVKNFFKDMGSGLGEHLFGDVRKVLTQDSKPKSAATLSQNEINNTANLGKVTEKERAASSQKSALQAKEVIHSTQDHANVNKSEHNPQLGEAAGKPAAKQKGIEV